MKFRILRNEAAPEGGEGGGGAAVATPPAAAAPATPAPDPAPSNPASAAAPQADPPPAAAPAAADPVFFKPDGTLADGWQDHLPDEFAPRRAEFARYKDLPTILKTLDHHRKQGPAYPGEQSTADDVDRFRDLAKVPREATLEAYGIPVPENATAEGKAFYEAITKTAHENHLSAPGFAAVVQKFQELQGAEYQAQQDAAAQAKQNAQNTLVSEWRGDYEQNASTARHVARTMMADAGIDPESSSLGALKDNPDFMRLMLHIGKRSAEDRTVTPSGYGDLRSDAIKADAIRNGTDPVWGKKYTEGTSEEKLAAYKEMARLLNSATR